MKVSLPTPEFASQMKTIDEIKRFLAHEAHCTPRCRRRTRVFCDRNHPGLLYYADSLDGENWTAYKSERGEKFKFWGKFKLIRADDQG
jgi:hypothetical protein